MSTKGVRGNLMWMLVDREEGGYKNTVFMDVTYGWPPTVYVSQILYHTVNVEKSGASILVTVTGDDNRI